MLRLTLGATLVNGFVYKHIFNGARRRGWRWHNRKEKVEKDHVDAVSKGLHAKSLYSPNNPNNQPGKKTKKKTN